MKVGLYQCFTPGWRPQEISVFASKGGFGGNNGNLLWMNGSFDLLSHYTRKISPVWSHDAASTSEDYSLLAIPLANFIGPQNERAITSLASFVRELTIPVVGLSVGIQLPLGGDISSLDRVEDATKELLSAILDKGPSLAVRGERTRDYFEKLGFKDIVTLGCPSVNINLPFAKRDSPNQFALSPQVKKYAYTTAGGSTLMSDEGGPISIMEAIGARFFPQDTAHLRMMLGQDQKVYGPQNTVLPHYSNHSQFSHGIAEYHLSVSAWLNSLSRHEYAVMPRVHGAVAAELAGVPTITIPHDLRVLELSQTIGLRTVGPQILENVRNAHELDELFQNKSEFLGRLPSLKAGWSEYLESHGLSRIHPLHESEYQWVDPILGAQSHPST